MPALTPDTQVTLGAAVAAIVAFVSATWWFARQLNDIQGKLRTLTKDAAASYTLSAASEQALRMAVENPGLRVPDPRDPSKIITTATTNYGVYGGGGH